MTQNHMDDELRELMDLKPMVPPPAFYGKELILDLHDCDAGRFTRDSIGRFLVKVGEMVGDEGRPETHFWGDVGVEQSTGVDAVQASQTSCIVVHTLNSWSALYLSLFSRKDFDDEAVGALTAQWFGAGTGTKRVIVRD